MQTLRPILMLCAALTLGACGSESSNDDPAPGPLLSDEAGAGNGSGPESGDGTGDEGGSTSEDGSATGEDAVPDGDGTGDEGGSTSEDGSTTGEDAVPDGDGAGDEGGSTSEDGSTPGEDTDPDGDGAGDDVDIGTGGESGGDDIDAGAEPDVIQPGIPGNLAATRLILGMERVLKATLLDLNTRYASGLPLSEQQQVCLGSYDPARGEAAFALGCERALATGDVEVYVEQGSLYRTADCAADLAAGTADRCVMESARVIMRTRFAVPPDQEGQGRPRPTPGSGVVVSYAIGAPLLTLESDDQSPLPLFDCAFELQNGALLPSIGGRDLCDAQVRDAADHIDFLSPVVL